MHIKEAQDIVHRITREKGFWDKERNDSEMFMLMTCEIAEACEALRHGNPPSDHIPQHSGVAEEMADAVIRIMDYCGGRGIDLEKVLHDKIAFNASRPYKHGKQF